VRSSELQHCQSSPLDAKKSQQENDAQNLTGTGAICSARLQARASPLRLKGGSDQDDVDYGTNNPDVVCELTKPLLKRTPSVTPFL
jgi:hypothetical protein